MGNNWSKEFGRIGVNMQTLYYKSNILSNNVPLRSNSRDVDPQSFLLEIFYDQDIAQELVICKTAL